MKEVTFLHTADIHLGASFSHSCLPPSLVPGLRADLWRSFESIIEECGREKLHILFIAGDLFEDNSIRISDLKRVEQLFRSIPDTKIYISPGNHDNWGSHSPYQFTQWSENVIVFESGELGKREYNEWLDIWGYGWKERIIKTNVLHGNDFDASKTNVLLIHGDITGSGSSYLPVGRDDIILNSFDYAALGHIHKPMAFGETVRYPGSPEPFDFSDIGDRGIIKGTISPGKVSTEFFSRSLKRFCIEIVEITPEMTYYHILNQIRARADKPERDFYRIVLKGLMDRNIDLEDLSNQSLEEFRYMELKDETLKDYDLESLYQHHQDDIIGCFISEMMKTGLSDPVHRDALYYGLEALLKEYDL
ncbi:MAG: DNA repair exonuclease [Eubacteriaceae bacterium]|nr:DNA repair exonuclease [Eubacteriaceae bacterium]